MEEELKQRGRGRHLPAQHGSTQRTTLQNSSSEDITIIGDLAVRQTADSSRDRASESVERPQRTLKDVNILEDLNQELFGSRGLAIVDMKASSAERRPENAENKSVWVSDVTRITM